MPVSSNSQYANLAQYTRRCNRNRVFNVLPSFGPNYISRIENKVHYAPSGYASLIRAYPRFPSNCRSGCRFSSN